MLISLAIFGDLSTKHNRVWTCLYKKINWVNKWWKKGKKVPKPEALLPWFLCPYFLVSYSSFFLYDACACYSLLQLCDKFPSSLKPSFPLKLPHSYQLNFFPSLSASSAHWWRLAQFWMKTTNQTEKSLELQLGVQSTDLSYMTVLRQF